jgi:hypothetical protein
VVFERGARERTTQEPSVESDVKRTPIWPLDVLTSGVPVAFSVSTVAQGPATQGRLSGVRQSFGTERWRLRACDLEADTYFLERGVPLFCSGLWRPWLWLVLRGGIAWEKGLPDASGWPRFL